MKYRLVIGWFKLFAKYDDGTVSSHPLVRIPYPWPVKVASVRLCPCLFCGGEHEMPNEAILTCPRIPSDHIYLDQEYGSGPRGQLIRVVEQ